jgi:four helix bundle protein
VSKAGIVVEEADECQYWLELLVELDLVQPAAATQLITEAEEFVAILTAARRTAQRGLKKP